jgi:NADPH:quinone reductase-like Zn-dependent oxidoreductase
LADADEVHVIPEAAWVKMPARLSFEAAAMLPCAGVTAYHALFEATQLRPGDTVLSRAPVASRSSASSSSGQRAPA